jgi:hypothetical protein
MQGLQIVAFVDKAIVHVGADYRPVNRVYHLLMPGFQSLVVDILRTIEYTSVHKTHLGRYLVKNFVDPVRMFLPRASAHVGSPPLLPTRVCARPHHRHHHHHFSLPDGTPAFAYNVG